MAFDFGDPSSYYISPLQSGFTGALQGLAPYLGPQRAPVSPWAALAGALGGFGQGAQQAGTTNLKNSYLASEAQKAALENRLKQIDVNYFEGQNGGGAGMPGAAPRSSAIGPLLSGNMSAGGGGGQGILGQGAPLDLNAPAAGDPQAAPSQGILGGGQQPAGNGFLMDPATILKQAQEASKIPALQGKSQQLFKLYEQMIDKGMGAQRDGTIGVFPGYREATQGNAFANEYGKTVAKNNENVTVAPGATLLRGPNQLGPGGTGIGGGSYTNPNSPALINLSMAGELEGEKQSAKDLADIGRKFYEASQTARTDRSKLKLAGQLLDNGTTTGTGTETRAAIENFGRSVLGMDIGKNLGNTEALQAIGQQLAIGAQPPGQGAVSNYERELYAKAAPLGLGRSTEGNKFLVNLYDKFKAQDEGIAPLYAAELEKNKRITPQFLTTVREYYAKSAVTPEDIKKLEEMAGIQSKQAAPPANGPTITNDAQGRAAYDALPSGATYRDPNGITRTKK